MCGILSLPHVELLMCTCSCALESMCMTYCLCHPACLIGTSPQKKGLELRKPESPSVDLVANALLVLRAYEVIALRDKTYLCGIVDLCLLCVLYFLYIYLLLLYCCLKPWHNSSTALQTHSPLSHFNEFHVLLLKPWHNLSTVLKSF